MQTKDSKTTIAILRDAEGDEFPLSRWPNEPDESLLARAAEIVKEGAWRPVGELRLDGQQCPVIETADGNQCSLPAGHEGKHFIREGRAPA